MSITAPDDLTELDQWVVWSYEQRDGKKTKVPRQVNGKPASSTDPATWTSFDAAVAAVEGSPRKFAGVGFVFAESDPYCGIDLDDCLGPGGSVKPWAQPILESFGDTYAEVSPSGYGVKIWSRAKLPGNGKKVYVDRAGKPVAGKEQSDGAIEIYDKGRFFTVTGKVFSGRSNAGN